MTTLSAGEVLRAAGVVEPAGDRLARLFDSHYDRLYRLALRMSGTIDDALDLVQEAFLRAAQSPAAVPRGVSAEEAWLVRVLVNIQRDRWRRRAVRRRYMLEVTQQARDSRASEVESAVVARATVWRALAYLPPRRRAVLVMRELEDLPVAAIASLLGISEITVRWHVVVARRELGKLLGTGESR
jgi:RNA polymerase sigma-70 factor (ECF subfamily)